MSKKLEEVLNLPPMEDSMSFEEVTPVKTKEEMIQDAAELVNALSASEKIDMALTTVTGLLEHDSEMDEISANALATYKDLIALGLNVPDMHAGKIYEVASTMLKTAMEARDAKVQKKLKMLDLQIKKLKVDRDDDPNHGVSENGAEFDRNELLKYIVDNKNSEDTDK